MNKSASMNAWERRQMAEEIGIWYDGVEDQMAEFVYSSRRLERAEDSSKKQEYRDASASHVQELIEMLENLPHPFRQ